MAPILPILASIVPCSETPEITSTDVPVFNASIAI